MTTPDLIAALREARDALAEQVAECFDARCEMCIRHEATLTKLDTLLTEAGNG